MSRYAVADLGGGAARGARAPLGARILSISCSFSGKFGKIVCWRPPGEILDPPLVCASQYIMVKCLI